MDVKPRILKLEADQKVDHRSLELVKIQIQGLVELIEALSDQVEEEGREQRRGNKSLCEQIAKTHNYRANHERRMQEMEKELQAHIAGTLAGLAAVPKEECVTAE